VKKELLILLLAFITTVGFSGAVAAVNGDNNNNNRGPGMNIQDNNIHGWVVVWRGTWWQWRHSWWWRHFHSMDFWWHGRHYKATRLGRFVILKVQRRR
jgi:hypothetical protein